ncbi:MAG: hypothetical protein FJ095_18370 [Deltaproteobacteria bacterium]|nr:hypothetical protein [Deltaproteobacteria bacterium]
MSVKRLSLFALPLLAFVAATPANAADTPEPSAADKATARALLDEGDALLRKGSLQAAHDKYKAADAIMGVPTTGVALADAQAKLGLLVEAADTLARVQRFPTKAGEPKAFTAAREEAARKLPELGPSIPSLTVALAGGVTATPSMRVSIDGAELAEPVRFLPRKVNPGSHEVVVDAGDRRGTASVTLAERESRTVEVALPAVLVPTSGANGSKGTLTSTPAGEGALAAAEASRTEGGTPTRLHPAVWAGLGLTGAGLVAGAVTGGLALGKKGSLETECPGGLCVTPESQEALDSATTLAHVSTSSFVVAGAAGGVTALVWALTRSPSSAPRATVVPHVGAGYLGLSGSF